MQAEMVKIVDCEVTDCVYNKSKECHAMAITVGGPHPACDTFASGIDKGGVEDMQGGVGACRVSNCQYNLLLECTAPGIKIGNHEQHADCYTFRQK